MKFKTGISLLVCLLALGLFAEFVEAQYGTRRRMRRRTAVVASSASRADANAAEQEAAAADARADSSEAAAAASQAEVDSLKAASAAEPAAGALPIGSIVETLPEGCEKKVVDNVEYYFDGTNYYRAAFQGSQLVYVTAKP